MIDLKECVEKIRMDYGIHDENFNFDFSRFMVSNNWFGSKPVFENSCIMVEQNLWENIRDKVIEFCKYYGAKSTLKKELLQSKMNTEFPKTSKVFEQYCDEVNLDDNTAYLLLDFLLYFLPGEIFFSDDKEITSLMDEGFENLSKVYADILADFVNYTKKNHKTSYRSMYFMNQYGSKVEGNWAYSPNEYLEIMYYLYNKDYIEENRMYEKAAKSKKYVDTWLFLALHFICAVRNTDLVRFPHPRILMEPEKLLEEVNRGTFSDEDARGTLYSILWHLSAVCLTPNKTKRGAGVASIKFHVPESVEVHIGTLLAIAEAHYRISGGLPEGNLIQVISSYEKISRYMGDEIGELFVASNFRSRSANKSFMQMIFMMTDDILENDEEFNVKGYILAALARSHKGSYGEFAKTTSIYLKDAKMSGYTPEFVARELFERGVLSFIPSMLLRLITGGEYNKLSIKNQTKLIKELNMKPYEIESIVGLSQNSYKHSAEIAIELYRSASKEDVLRILHRIGNGNAASKQNECLCLMTAMNKICPYNDRRSCPGCEFEISTKATMFLMVSEYQRLATLYHNSLNELIKTKCKTLIKDIVLPSIDEMLHCVGEQYGNDAVESLERIIKETSYAK